MTKKTKTKPKIDPERSRVMRAVKGKNTGPEIAVRRALWSAGLRYRLHDKRLPGKPDVVFASRQIALFINGCFWHGHKGCPRCRIPRTRRKYWLAKIEGNRRRDTRTRSALRSLGWKTLVIWECKVKDDRHLTSLIARIKNR